MKIGDVFNPHLVFGAIRIPTPIAQRTDISAGAKLVFGVLLDIYNSSNGKSETIKAPKNELAKETGISTIYLSEYIQELKSRRLIRCLGSHRYSLIVPNQKGEALP